MHLSFGDGSGVQIGDNYARGMLLSIHSFRVVDVLTWYLCVCLFFFPLFFFLVFLLINGMGIMDARRLGIFLAGGWLVGCAARGSTFGRARAA